VISEKLLAFTLLGAGWVLWLLLALSVLSVAVMVERALYFGSRRMSKLFPRLLELCLKGDLKAAAALATSDSMEAEVVRAAAGVTEGATPRWRGGAVHHRPAPARVREVALRARDPGNNAPFIGLFGTVLGIIRAFADLAVANKGGGGSTTASFVMAGISEALVAHRGRVVSWPSPRCSRSTSSSGLLKRVIRAFERARKRHRFRAPREKWEQVMAGGRRTTTRRESPGST